MVAATKVKDDTRSTPVAGNCTAFCEVCNHSVYNIEKHIQTEDHKRNLKKGYPEGTEKRVVQLNK